MFDKHSHIKASLVSRVSQQQYAQLRVSCSTRLSYCHDASSIPATHQSFHVHHKASTQPSKHGHTRANSAATRSLKSSQSCGSSACGCSRWRRRGGGASKHALAESQGTNAIEHLFGPPRHHPAALAACAAGSQPGPMEPPFLPDFAPQDHVKRRSMSHEPSESLLEKFWRNFGESLRTLLSSYRR